MSPDRPAVAASGSPSIVRIGVPDEGSDLARTPSSSHAQPSRPRPPNPSAPEKPSTWWPSSNHPKAADSSPRSTPRSASALSTSRGVFLAALAALMLGLGGVATTTALAFFATQSRLDQVSAQEDFATAVLTLRQALTTAWNDPLPASKIIGVQLPTGKAALDRWVAFQPPDRQPPWQRQWAALDQQLRPLQEQMGTLPMSDSRMRSAATASLQDLEALLSGLSREPRPTQIPSSLVGLSVALLWSVVAGLLLAVLLVRRLRPAPISEDPDGIQQSLVVLMDHLREIAQGDLTGRAPVSEDAAGTLADILNHAVDRLRTLARDVKLTSEQTTAASQQATDTTGVLVDRAREDMASQVANGAEVLRLAEGVRQLSVLAKDVTTSAATTATAAFSGAEAITSAHVRVGEVRRLNEEAGDRVTRLAMSSREIATVITIVNGLSDQVGVLADQAALQAARAGEPGKAFRIVALGMEELATQTGLAARKIGTLIEAALGDIQAARTAMAGAVSGTDEISRLVDVSTDASRQAVGRSEDLVASVDRLVVLLEEQHRIAGVLDENTKEGLARVADGQGKAQQAAESVMVLIEAVRELARSADRFRV